MNRRHVLKQLGAGVAATSFLAPARAVAAPNTETPEAESTTEHGALLHLDHNENAYGPSKKAIVALQESANQSGRYPDADGLQNALAAYHSESHGGAKRQVTAEEIVLGCGSTDVLRMAASAFLSAESTLIMGTPTCGLIAKFGHDRGATVAEIPLRKDHSHDLDAMLKRAKGVAAGGLIYLCNPNNPTSTLTPSNDVERFLGEVPSNFHVVVDEAYHHYAGGSGAYFSVLERPQGNPRVIVTRTFSAAYGLAGARVGYGVAAAPVAQKLTEQGLPFAVNRPALMAAAAALTDRQHIESCVKRNFDDRQEFMNQVNARMLRALDSHANFMCLNVMRPADVILKHYQENNIALAPLIPSMPTYLRISLGSPKEMREFWRVWDLLGSHPMSM